jgi:hypothetical protein
LFAEPSNLIFFYLRRGMGRSNKHVSHL